MDFYFFKLNSLIFLKQLQNNNTTTSMPTLTHEKISKKFFLKKIYTQNFFPTQSRPGIAAGTPSQYFLPLKISCPKKRPFCDFSVFEHFYIPFRTIIYAIYRYYNLKLRLLTIYLIDGQIVSAYISKMLLK